MKQEGNTLKEFILHSCSTLTPSPSPSEVVQIYTLTQSTWPWGACRWLCRALPNHSQDLSTWGQVLWIFFSPPRTPTAVLAAGLLSLLPCSKQLTLPQSGHWEASMYLFSNRNKRGVHRNSTDIVDSLPIACLNLSSGEAAWSPAVPGLGKSSHLCPLRRKNCHRFYPRAPRQMKNDFSWGLLSQDGSCKMNDSSSENRNNRERERSHITPQWDCLEKSGAGEAGSGLQRETWDVWN